MDSRLRGNDDDRVDGMNQQIASPNPDQRRAGIRRTVWITAAVALSMFVLFFVTQFAQH
jgi:hypothetical protein